MALITKNVQNELVVYSQLAGQSLDGFFHVLKLFSDAELSIQKKVIERIEAQNQNLYGRVMYVCEQSNKENYSVELQRELLNVALEGLGGLFIVNTRGMMVGEDVSDADLLGLFPHRVLTSVATARSGARPQRGTSPSRARRRPPRQRFQAAPASDDSSESEESDVTTAKRKMRNGKRFRENDEAKRVVTDIFQVLQTRVRSMFEAALSEGNNENNPDEYRLRKMLRALCSILSCLFGVWCSFSLLLFSQNEGMFNTIALKTHSVFTDWIFNITVDYLSRILQFAILQGFIYNVRLSLYRVGATDLEMTAVEKVLKLTNYSRTVAHLLQPMFNRINVQSGAKSVADSLRTMYRDTIYPLTLSPRGNFLWRNLAEVWNAALALGGGKIGLPAGSTTESAREKETYVFASELDNEKSQPYRVEVFNSLICLLLLATWLSFYTASSRVKQKASFGSLVNMVLEAVFNILVHGPSAVKAQTT